MKKTTKPAGWIKYTLIAVIILALVLLLSYPYWRGKLPEITVEQLSQYILSFGAWAFIFGMLAVLLQTVIPVVPFVLIAGANVLIFGLWWGFVINYVMSIVGAALTFWFARSVGQQKVLDRLEKYPAAAAFNKRLESNGYFYIFIGRLLPVVPSTLINIGAGAMGVKASHFLAATIVGKLPMILLESYIGHDVMHFRQNKGRLLILVGIFVILLIIGGWLKKRIAHKSAT
ncbi:TVP38/TMEM64 family protein [Paenibacillus sp. 32O-W]|uniref:TVP38/TMEM64 family protein n=1 Tax=Paenibacillus sp. 32O-W TaxID=1695218 RepID=UPI0011AAE092|nr:MULTISPECIES: TVP38/TMEM64 family protein [Paenibacillaceae]